jgi:hypothetical protein
VEKTNGLGVYNLRARMYQPASGTFIREDPVGGSPSYAFASGRPTVNDFVWAMYAVLVPVVSFLQVRILVRREEKGAQPGAEDGGGSTAR